MNPSNDLSRCAEKRWISLFLLVAWVFASAGQAAAGVYKWKDDNGKWHFTDDAGKLPQNRSSRTPGTSRDTPSSQETRPSKPSGAPAQKLDRKIEDGFQQLGEALGKGLEAGLEKMGEELGKAFGGMGDWLAVVEANQPDMKEKVFEDQEEQARYDVQQLLLGMFLMCQFEFIVQKSATCSLEGVEIDEKKKAKFDDFVTEIDPRRNTRQNLLIRSYHKNRGEVWEITQEGKSSLKKSPDQNKKTSI